MAVLELGSAIHDVSAGRNGDLGVTVSVGPNVPNAQGVIMEAHVGPKTRPHPLGAPVVRVVVEPGEQVALTLHDEEVGVRPTLYGGTFGEEVVDVFYVKDVFGLKITHDGKREKVRGQILAALREGAERAALAIAAAE